MQEEAEGLAGSTTAGDGRHRAEPLLRQHAGAELQPDDTAEVEHARVAHPFFLDLHGFSHATAQIALQQVPAQPCPACLFLRSNSDLSAWCG
jgi:hypothetical protein